MKKDDTWKDRFARMRRERKRRTGVEANPQGISANNRTREGQHAPAEHGANPDPGTIAATEKTSAPSSNAAMLAAAPSGKEGK